MTGSECISTSCTACNAEGSQCACVHAGGVCFSTYYWNESTGETSWNEPAAMQAGQRSSLKKILDFGPSQRSSALPYDKNKNLEMNLLPATGAESGRGSVSEFLSNQEELQPKQTTWTVANEACENLTSPTLRQFFHCLLSRHAYVQMRLRRRS